MSLRRIGLWSLTAVVLLAAAAAVGLHWASRSQTVLLWSIDRLAHKLPCRLVVEGLQGSLLEPVRAASIACENESMRIEARDVAIKWSPWQLRAGRLHVEHVQAASLLWTVRSGDRKGGDAPRDLRLPIEVHIAALEIGTAARVATNARVELRNISLAYEGDANAHRVNLKHLTTQWGELAGEVSLGSQAPLPLKAKLAVHSEQFPGSPLTADVIVSGTLSEFQAKADVSSPKAAVVLELGVQPFDPDPLRSISARSEDLDLALLQPDLPKTRLAVEFLGRGQGLQALTGQVRGQNRAAGPTDRKSLPLRGFQGNLFATAQSIRVTELMLLMRGSGRAEGSAMLTEGTLQLDLQVRDLDLRAIRGDLRATRMTGTVLVDSSSARHRITADLREGSLHIGGTAEVLNDRVLFERVAASAGGAQALASGELKLAGSMSWRGEGLLRNFDPSRFGDFPAARVSGELQASGALRPQWSMDVRYRLASSRFRGQPLAGSGRLSVSPRRLSDADAYIDLAGNRVRLRGAFGRPGDELSFDIRAPRLAAVGVGVQGSLHATGKLGGSRESPALQVQGQANDLAFGGMAVGRWTLQVRVEQADDPLVRLQSRMREVKRPGLTVEQVAVDLRGSLSKHSADVRADLPGTRAEATVEGGWSRTANAWNGTVQRLHAEGDHSAALLQPFTLELGRDRAALGRAEMQIGPARVQVEQMLYRSGRLTSAGAVSGLAVAPLLKLMDRPPAVESSLVMGGRWSIEMADAVNGSVEVMRESGDVAVLAEQRVPLGLSDVRLQLRAEANRVTAEFQGTGSDLSVRGEARSMLERRAGAWGLPGSAPLKISGEAKLPSLRPLAMLAGRAVLLDGNVALNVRGEGTVADPRLTGELSGEHLRFENVESGIFLREGLLRAVLSDGAIEVREFRIKGGEGTFEAKGKLAGTTDAPDARVDWAAKRLAILQHPDLRLAVTGSGRLAVKDGRIALAGELRADRGRIELRSITAPALSSDVVVAGRERPLPISERALNSTLDLRLDLGEDFHVNGRGAQMRLAGNVRLHSTPGTPLLAEGDIVVRQGTYEAYGQKLDIEKGVLRFTGPVDNPALEVRAMRKNQEIEAGVEVTGTARDPRVRLVSKPDVPDPEKLSWLVLGTGLEAAGTADAQKLQMSAIAMAAGLGTLPLQQQLKRATGLDAINYIPGSDSSEGGVVAIGKRISDRVYLSHEYGLNAASSTFRLSYQLSRYWSVRTESGETDAVDLFFTLSFD